MVYFFVKRLPLLEAINTIDDGAIKALVPSDFVIVEEPVFTFTDKRIIVSIKCAPKVIDEIDKLAANAQATTVLS